MSERKLPNSVQGIRVLLHGAMECVLRKTGSPRFIEPLLEGATLVGPSIVIITRGHDGADTGKMRRMRDGRQHLRGSNVRTSKHPHLAVGIGQRGRPLHSVIAVVRFMLEWIPFAVRCVASTNVLNDYDIAAGCSLHTEADRVRADLVVWSALQKNRKVPVRFWPIDVSSKSRAIAHFCHDTVFDGHGVRFSRPSGLRSNGQAYERDYQ